MGFSPARLHEYPDPDAAAYITRYPWARDDDYVPTDPMHNINIAERSSPKEAVLTGSREDTNGLFMDPSSFTQDPGLDFDPDYMSPDSVTR